MTRCSTDVEMKLGGRASLKLHAGPGRVNRTVKTPNGVQTVTDPEVHFIFDQDLYAGTNIKLREVMDVLSELHDHADRVFSDAITDLLHDAMEAVEV